MFVYQDPKHKIIPMKEFSSTTSKEKWKISWKCLQFIAKKIIWAYFRTFSWAVRIFQYFFNLNKNFQPTYILSMPINAFWLLQALLLIIYLILFFLLYKFVFSGLSNILSKSHLEKNYFRICMWMHTADLEYFLFLCLRITVNSACSSLMRYKWTVGEGQDKLKKMIFS